MCDREQPIKLPRCGRDRCLEGVGRPCPNRTVEPVGEVIEAVPLDSNDELAVAVVHYYIRSVNLQITRAKFRVVVNVGPQIHGVHHERFVGVVGRSRLVYAPEPPWEQHRVDRFYRVQEVCVQHDSESMPAGYRGRRTGSRSCRWRCS